MPTAQYGWIIIMTRLSAGAVLEGWAAAIPDLEEACKAIRSSAGVDLDLERSISVKEDTLRRLGVAAGEVRMI